VLAATVVHRLLSAILRGVAGRNISIFLASWVSVVVTAIMGSLELGLSYEVHQVPFKTILTAMAGWHMIIGVGEGLITVAVVNFMDRLGFSGGGKNGSGVND